MDLDSRREELGLWLEMEDGDDDEKEAELRDEQARRAKLGTKLRGGGGATEERRTQTDYRGDGGRASEATHNDNKGGKKSRKLEKR